MNDRVRAMLAELPGALLLATLTAVVTLLLAIALSTFTGQANRQHQAETRCYNAEVIGMLREVVRNAPSLTDVDLDRFPPVNTEGLDCSFFEIPIEAAPEPVRP